MSEDLELVRRVQAGDRKAFDVLIIKYQRRIVHVINGFLDDPVEALDVAQEVFIKTYPAIANFRGDSSFYTWLYRIAINTAKNALVYRSKRPPAQDVDAKDCYNAPRLEDIDTPEDNLMRDQLEQVIHKAIESLPPDMATAIRLREFDGMSYEEVSEAMDCPIGTVRSRIFRAREAIDKEIKAFNRAG